MPSSITPDPSAPLTPEREQEIRAREAAATAGPWGTYHENPMSDYSRLIDIAADLQETGTGYRCRRYIGQLESDQIDNDPAHKDWDADQDNEQAAADAEFIAHARTDVPALLAEIDRLRAEFGELSATNAFQLTELDVARVSAVALHDELDTAIKHGAVLSAEVDRLRAELSEVKRQAAKDVHTKDAEFAARPTRTAELREISDAIIGLDFRAVTRSLPIAANLAARLRRMADAAERDEVAPRTERSYWVAIADALNAAHSADMPVGVDLDGTLTDHRAWSVIWDRAGERWTVAGYDDGDNAERGASR